ncbi:MAG: M28 family peptidase [Bacteroidetes bacterium]|nr:M28 family peptidase [Bacteroidota bacterium]
MKHPYIFMILILLHAGVFAQSPDPQSFGNTINIDDLTRHMEVLASDSLEGREAGKKGQKMAADYIKNEFERMGLKPVVPVGPETSYFQDIGLYTNKLNTAQLKSKNLKMNHLEDMVCFTGDTEGKDQKLSLVYVGEGKASDFENLDVKGKAVLVVGNSMDVITNTELAESLGAAAYIAVSTKNKAQFERQLKMFRWMLSGSRMGLEEKQSNIPSFAIPPEAAVDILGIKSEKLADAEIGQMSSIKFNIDRNSDRIPSENVLGFIEGTDKKDEVLVITAHYDHLGVKGEKIFKGADDNGSGTVALLEIAEAFAKAVEAGKRPRRSVLFMALTAEEKGLLGSDYYTRHPIFPLENTVVNLNMDMVGHLDDDHRENARFVSVVGSDWLSTDLHKIHENANSTYVNLDLDYQYNSPSHPERFYYRSDQYNFAKHNIPVIFYTSGDHEDYHKASDTIENIKFDRIEGVAQLIFYTAWEIAFRDERLKVDRTPPK